MIQPAKRSNGQGTLAGKAYERIRDMIVMLTLAPGEVISEATLSVRLGIGRTPVREAIKELARDNLVVVMPQRGIVVSRIDLNEQMLVLEVLRGIEPLLVRRAAQRSSAQERERFKAIAARLQAAREAQDIATYMSIDREFDDLVDSCAGNRFASDAIQTLHLSWRRFWASQAQRGQVDQAFALHITLVRAIANGDPAAAAQAVNDMLDFNDGVVRSMMG